MVLLNESSTYLGINLSSVYCICKNAFDKSPINVILFKRKGNKTLNNNGARFDSGSKQLFRDMPLLDFALASN